MFGRVTMKWYLLYHLPVVAEVAAAAGKVMIAAAAIPLMADAEQVCLRQKQSYFVPLTG
jgi:hypothetical protein